MAIEEVALWAGLIVGIASIVLAVVAIVFTLHVDRSARQVALQTIQSLQRIEGEVDRSSSDTRELIKAAWDKMIGSVSGQIPAPADARVVASGIAAELRAELASLVEASSDSKQGSKTAKMDEIIDRLKKDLAAQVRNQATIGRPAQTLAYVQSTLERLSPEAKALLLEIRRRHISHMRYSALIAGPLRSCVEELRAAGFLVPLEGVDKMGNELIVYYYPPLLASILPSVTPLIDQPDISVVEKIKHELKRVGYYDDV